MIRDNIDNLRTKIGDIAERCGRNRQDVRLVAVSKRFPVKAILEAQNAGQVVFGENYIQETKEKYDELRGEVQFHFIGHLQSNKAAVAAQICSMIETVDRIKLAKILNNQLRKLNKKLDILIQVNIANDNSKSGISPQQADQLVQAIHELEMLRPLGLMTMPPFSDDPEDSRIHFKNLKELADDLGNKKLFFDNSKIELSMGMTNDYHVAIQEGATLVRIGTAIFGQRN
jgi:PLP dependent protein